MQNSLNLGKRAKYLFAQESTGTNSKRPINFPSTFPRYIYSGKGANLIDVDGNVYVDFISGLGTNILGYNHPKVVDAVCAQARNGCSYSLPHKLEVEVAELFREFVPHAEAVRFLKTGSEACSAALRIARAWTGQGAAVSEGYHGWHDEYQQLESPALGVCRSWKLSRKDDEARILVIEPPLDVYGDGRKAFEEKVNKFGCVVMDEIVTGFRVPKYSVSRDLDLKPDILCFGKSIANGYPLAIVAGSREAMCCGEYFISSTYSGDSVSLAACKATLEEIKKRDVKELFYYGNRFQDKLNSLDPEMKWVGYGTRSQFNLFECEKSALFSQEMARAGFLFGRALFYTFAHMEADFEEKLFNIAQDVLRKINGGQVKLEQWPKPTFTR